MAAKKRSDSGSAILSRRLGRISTVCCQRLGFESTQILVKEYESGKSYDEFSEEAKSIIEKAEAFLANSKDSAL